jgi:chromosome segregation ATPase
MSWYTTAKNNTAEINALEIQIKALDDKKQFLPRQIAALKQELDTIPRQIDALKAQIRAIKDRKN